MPDWAFTTLGYTLAAIAAASFIYAFVTDRSRGRPRCPKCWYDLRGHLATQPAPPWTCPECGRVLSKPRQAHRTRVRFRYVALTFILWPLAYFTINLPDVIARGWWALAPRPVLVAMIALMPPTPPPSYNPIRYPVWLDEAVHQYFDHEPLLWWPGESLLASWAAYQVADTKLDRRKDVIAAIVARVCRDPIRAMPEINRGRVILQLAAQTYRRAETYEDDAIALFPGMNGVNPVISGWTTRIRRSGARVRIEALATPGFGPRYTDPAWVIARGQSCVLHQFRMSMTFTGDPMTLAGTSFGDPCPSLNLLGFLVSQSRGHVIATYTDSLEREHTIEGHPCYDVSFFNMNPGRRSMRIAVDKESFLVRGMTIDDHITVVLHPRVYHPITDDQFEEPLPTTKPVATITRESIMNEFAEHIFEFAKSK